ncbi:MAG: LPS-assembly protein LptD, partial [Acidobacteriaceae bacterium]|nr:LPS-assembly protein LptD [Acidobacteriaceae bacterium]
MLFFSVACTGLALAPTALCQTVSIPQSEIPPPDEIWYGGRIQESDGPLKHLHQNAEVKTSDMDISADEIDFNSDTNWANARGHVHLRHFASKDDIKADRADYNIKTHEGKFYNVEGTSPAKVMTSPGVLTTTNPFYFHAEWAERINDRYILHNGYMTDCHIPKPWWTFGSPLFDVIPGDRAIGHRTVFRLKNIPVFFFPYYYRPLGKNPRQSGFLTPEIGHSSFYGYLYGAGYYWAMSRSYDMTGYLRYFSQRGPAYLYDFRGKPTKNTDFDFNLYDVDDRGVSQGGGTPLKEGGLEFELRATSYFDGFTAHLDYTYLSSFLFRQAFSYNFVTAIYNQINSIGYLQRHFDNGLYTLTFAGQRDQLYEATTLINQRQNQVVL